MGGLQPLVDWAVSAGAEINNADISPDNPRTFQATADIGAAECIMRIPHHLLIHAARANSDEEYGEDFRLLQDQAGKQLDERSVLCLLLVLERARGPSSYWALYIDVLPTHYDDPFWWREEELCLFKGTRLGRALEIYRPGLDQLQRWVQQLESIHRQRTGKDGVLSSGADGWALTWEAVHWARSVMWSRAFSIRRLGGWGKVTAMVPVLDMLDHRHAHPAGWHTGHDGSAPLHYATLAPVQKGSVLYINYSAKSNEEFLLGYGFILPANPADNVYVSLAASRARPDAGDEAEEGGDELEARQQELQLLQRHQLMAAASLSSEQRLHLPDPLPRALQDAMALLLLPEARLEAACAALMAGAPLDVAQLVEEPGATLPALLALHQRLSDKLAGIVTEAELRPHRAALASKGWVWDADEPGPQPANQAAPDGPSMQLSRSEMAAVYVLGQRRILRAALATTSERLARALLLQSNNLHSSMPGGHSSRRHSPYQAWLQQEGVQLHKGTQESKDHAGLFPGAGVECAVTGASPPGPAAIWSGITILEEIAPGDVLARVPVSCCAAAISADILQDALALYVASRLALLPGLSVEALTTPELNDGVDGMLSALESLQRCSALVDKLAEEVAPGLAPRLVAQGSQELAALLDGTPVQLMAEDELDELSAGFQEWLQRHAAARAQGAQGGASMEPGSPGWRRLFGVWCWARLVVQQRAVQLPQSPGRDGGDVALVPLVHAVPSPLRAALIDIQWQPESSCLLVTSRGPLHPGMRLCSALLEAGSSDYEVLMLSHGPEAVSALSAHTPGQHFELGLSAPEDDPHFSTRTELMAAAGTGFSQRLLQYSSAQEAQLLCTLALCMASPAALSSPAASSCLTAYKRASQALPGSGTEGAEQLVAGAGAAGGPTELSTAETVSPAAHQQHQSPGSRDQAVPAQPPAADSGSGTVAAAAGSMPPVAAGGSGLATALTELLLCQRQLQKFLLSDRGLLRRSRRRLREILQAALESLPELPSSTLPADEGCMVSGDVPAGPEAGGAHVNDAHATHVGDAHVSHVDDVHNGAVTYVRRLAGLLSGWVDMLGKPRDKTGGDKGQEQEKARKKARKG